MTLVVTCPTEVDTTGDYSWWELTARCRAHKDESLGIPVAVDATQIPEHNCRRWLAPWIGSVIPFNPRHNMADRLPQRPLYYFPPDTCALENRLIDQERDRLQARQALQASDPGFSATDTSRAEGDDMTPLTSGVPTLDSLDDISIGAHVPEEDVTGGDN